MNDWIILGIEKTNDLRKVKKAYAEKSKLYHPETHPDEFQKLHNAYKRIAAEIRSSTEYQEENSLQKPVIVQEAEKQLEATIQKSFWQKLLGMNLHKEVPKPVRDLKQDEDFLQLVKEAAKNFEARHTDKRDPDQVARVEHILQHDERNSKLLRQFQWLLYNEFFAEGWRSFFINTEFLERQYEPEFINGMTEILKSRLLEIQRAKKGSYGLGMQKYFIIVYGDIFEGMEHLQFEKNIYHKELLQGLIGMFYSNYDKRNAYMGIEENTMLTQERNAFLLYRNTLRELDADKPSQERIKEIISEAFQREDVSKVIFDLFTYLIASENKNILFFRKVLEQACEDEWCGNNQDEIEILKMELME